MIKEFTENNFSKDIKPFIDEDLLIRSAKFNQFLCFFILGLSLLNLVLNIFSLDVYFPNSFLINIIKNYTYNPIFYILISLSLFLINSKRHNSSIFDKNISCYKIINYSLAILTGVYCLFSFLSFLGIPIVNGFGPQFQDSWLFLIIFGLYFINLLLIVLKKEITLTQILGALILILGFVGGLFYYSGANFFALALNYIFYVIILPYVFITSYPNFGIMKFFYLNTEGSKFARKVIILIPIILAISSVFIVVLDRSNQFELFNVSALIAGVALVSLFLVMVSSTYKFTKSDIYMKIINTQIKEASEEAFLLKNNLETVQGITKVVIGNWDLKKGYHWSSNFIIFLKLIKRI